MEGRSDSTDCSAQIFYPITHLAPSVRSNSVRQGDAIGGDGGETEIEQISDHMKKHEKPSGEAEFGYYLAGLIEGSGYFGDQWLEILFFEKDISLAYYIKKRLGYGSVYFIKDKRAVKYVLRHHAGLKYVLDLVNGKFLTNCKINQLLKHDYGTKFGAVICPPLTWGVVSRSRHLTHLRCRGEEGGGSAPQPIRPNFSLLTNHYLAGFTDSDGYFGISTRACSAPLATAKKVVLRNPSLSSCSAQPDYRRSASTTTSPLTACLRIGVGMCSPLPEVYQRSVTPKGVLRYRTLPKVEVGQGVRLRFVLGQKDPTILQKVKSEFGGYLYHYKPTDNYLLELSSLSQNLQIIEYFDKFNLNSIKHLAFFKWRKAYRIVQRKEHLTEKGLSKIKLLGKSISELIK
jgi:hypothetical protein